MKTCPFCHEYGEIEATDVLQKIEHGGCIKQPCLTKTLFIRVPVYTCNKCDFRWTDPAECDEIRRSAIQVALKLGSPQVAWNK